MENTGKWFVWLKLCVLAVALALAAFCGAAVCAHAEAMEGSRLIGLFMTTDDLAPLVGDDGVLWAAVHPGTDASETEYSFGGVRGLCFIGSIGRDEQGQDVVISDVDEGISKADLNFADESFIQMNGTILFVPGPEEVNFYYNPVLEAQDGRVFTVPGDPMTVDASMGLPGAAVGQTLRDERKHAEDGVEVTDVTEVSMEIKTVREPLQITLLQFNDGHELLKSETCAPDSVPEELAMLEETDYLLVETRERTADGDVFTRREVLGREEDLLNTLLCREDRICVQRYHEIVWPAAR